MVISPPGSRTRSVNELMSRMIYTLPLEDTNWRKPHLGHAVRRTIAEDLLMTETSNIAVLGLGFILGLKHATDPDHIVAVTTFLGDERQLRRACGIGLFWGLGHAIALSVAGLVVVGLKIPMSKWLADRLELAVAAMLIILGARLISTVHTRWHEHHHDFGHRRLSLRPLFVGIV